MFGVLLQGQYDRPEKQQFIGSRYCTLQVKGYHSVVNSGLQLGYIFCFNLLEACDYIFTLAAARNTLKACLYLQKIIFDFKEVFFLEDILKYICL